MSALLVERQAAYEAALAKLNGKQRLFVRAYVGEAQCNAAEASRLAGYATKANVQGARMLANASIKEALAAYFATVAMPAEEVLRRISDHAAASIGDFLHIDEEAPSDEGGASSSPSSPFARLARLDLGKAKRAGKLHLVKKLKWGKYGPELELVDQQAALALLARHHKLLGAESGILQYIDLSKLSDEQIAAIANGADPLATLLGTKE